MRVLRATDYRRMPWKNGGGVTTEIAVYPEGAGLDDFEWRISMANVASDGPFSGFAGVDRTLAVLEGEGIVLAVEGLPEAVLTRTSPPLAFPADRVASARLIGGPILDLNVMTRRGHFAKRVARLGSGTTAVGGSSLTVIFCAEGAADLSDREDEASIGRHDAAVGTNPITVSAATDAVIYSITLERLT